MSSQIIVSACLVGIHCRFDCNEKSNQEMIELLERGQTIPVCPEQLAGLSTPRDPCEIRDDRVFTNKGKDVTEKFLFGVDQAMKLVDMIGIKEAYLKSKSPMCGSETLYDGTFSNKLKKGDGLFAASLKLKGIKVHCID